MTADDLKPCPCCQSLEIGESGDYEICDICGWEDDPVQSADPDYKGGANEMSLNQARTAWLARKSNSAGETGLP
ncbi:CPCC family cysteine-rich protein [Caballeronia sp. LZ035]|uniref:CPCC family cysteine-rich protein n=1 Tax=Caballeronia sp. LZ035 TaxID=3038568 RepID=UPI00285CE00B|nr:CPCC family cysteine-rich protein [Caballeronia sp. LZ035]MDR5760871.1 CPCC family cysteine-rich protein [Caballeronia sp. LZ035]